MFLRIFSLFIIVIFIISCDQFPFSKNQRSQVLDTIVDFSSVDTSPSFKVCYYLIDKAQKATCFRNTIHQKIEAELKKHRFIVSDSIFEVIFVDLLINSKGKIVLLPIEYSKKLKFNYQN